MAEPPPLLPLSHHPPLPHLLPRAQLHLQAETAPPSRQPQAEACRGQSGQLLRHGRPGGQGCVLSVLEVEQGGLAGSDFGDGIVTFHYIPTHVYMYMYMKTERYLIIITAFTSSRLKETKTKVLISILTISTLLQTLTLQSS